MTYIIKQLLDSFDHFEFLIQEKGIFFLLYDLLLHSGALLLGLACQPAFR